MEASPSNERTELLAFPIDVDCVLQHLQQDMRDDWFEDALQHQDLFAGKADLREVILSVLTEGNGRYLAARRNVCDVPKKGLGIRYSLETDFYDRFIYQAICSYLIPFFDPLLSHRVLGHRYDKRPRREKYLFKGRIELWQTFEGVTRTAIMNNEALFATDLINYFENITTEVIRSSFESLLPKVQASGTDKLLIRNAISTLCELLVSWGYSDRHGLPQNRDASSFIANVVLNAVDQEMVILGYDYYRYVDDIRIICKNHREARRVAAVLIGKLRTVGMNINSAKTKILTSDSSAAELSEFFPGSDDRTIAIDNMWRSRSRRIVIRSIKYIHQLLSECIKEKQTQSRQFRFSVNRLLRLIDAELFASRNPIAGELKALLIDSLEDHAASTDQYCRLLSALDLTATENQKIANFLCDAERSIHSWQNYHLWMLLARQKYRSENLIKLALHTTERDINLAEVPAIFIYLRCVGEAYSLTSLITKFSAEWPYYHKRNFLLATSELDREALRPLVQHLDPKIRGTVQRARSYYVNGLPLAARARTTIPQLYDNLDPYE